jgi:hypothetical protein
MVGVQLPKSCCCGFESHRGRNPVYHDCMPVSEMSVIEQKLEQGFYERRYTSPTAKCKVSHLTRGMYSLCGLTAEYGTGTQQEYERAADMPICRRCASKVI